MMSLTADAIYGVPTVGYEDALFTVGTAYMLSVFGRAPHRRPYGGIRMIAVKADRVVHCSSIPAFPSGGPSARENAQWTFSSEDGPVRPMGGAPAGGGRGPLPLLYVPSRMIASIASHTLAKWASMSWLLNRITWRPMLSR